MIHFNFDNTYNKLPAHFYSKVSPAHFPKAKLIAFNQELLTELGGTGAESTTQEELAQIFSGQILLEGSEPIAQVYAGHQFGHFNPQLGDGRALMLGEVLTEKNERFDLQLKGAGQTPFSRRGDGRSAIGPVLREYLVSEAMNRLGIKTTRALAAVWSGEEVYRQEVEPGGIFTRVASSHIRVGSFEYFLGRGDRESLALLIDYAIKRHYPNCESTEYPVLSFFEQVAARLNHLVTDWMAVGFIHGVMNTDNTSISGETIDYGPCAFMDQFQAAKVYSFIDRDGRYRYENQANILQWNLTRFAECLVQHVDKDQELAVKLLTEKLEDSRREVSRLWYQKAARKLGIINPISEDAALVNSWFRYLEANKLDFTLSHRYLIPELKGKKQEWFAQTPEFQEIKEQLSRRLDEFSFEQMSQLNPWLIPRNHQIEKAIQEALREGTCTHFHDLHRAYQNPYQLTDEFDALKLPPAPHEVVQNTFCGT